MFQPRGARSAPAGSGAGFAASAIVISLVAFNLRPALTGVGPVLPEIMRDTGLDATGASLLTTLPVLCLGAFGALAPGLARRVGMERAVAAVLVLLILGLLLRAGAGTAALFGGSLLAGAAIGLGNVLMPAVLKRLAAAQPALMTGIYTMVLCLGAAVAAAIAVPVAQLAGGQWRVSLAVWAAPTAVALLAVAWFWRRKLLRQAGGDVSARPAHRRALLADPLAWQVTMFMGLQSMLAYGVFGWLAPILRTRGDTPHLAGLVVGVSILAQVGASLPAPLVAVRLRHQGALCAAVMALITASMLGLTSAPLAYQWVFGVGLGIGSGAAFALAITLIVLRSPDTATAAQLSGMAQSIGYIMASLGPLLIGISHQRTGDWLGAEILFVIAGAAAALSGALAGRPRIVGALPATVR